MNKFSKILLAAIVAACLAFSAVALAGCGSGADDEQQIRDLLSQDLDQIKSLDDDAIAEMTSGVSEEDAAIFEMVGLDMNEYIKAFFDGFDYEITDVTVNDDDTATATVVCTMKSTAEIQAAWEESMANITGDDLTAIGQAMMDGIASVSPSQMDPITINLHKDSDGNWQEDDDVSSTFADALLAA